MKKSIQKLLVLSIALMMTMGCASQGKKGKKGANGANAKNNRNNNNENNDRLNDAENDVRDLQDQLDDLLDQIKRGQLAQANNNNQNQAPIVPGQVTPDAGPTPTPFAAVSPAPSPSPGATAGTDNTGAPLRVVRQVTQAFRFRGPASDTHGAGTGSDPQAVASDDQPVVRRRVE